VKNCLKRAIGRFETRVGVRCRHRVRRVPESRVQRGAKKSEVKIRLPGRAVQNTEIEDRVFVK
jgi:hypothetical protein